MLIHEFQAKNFLQGLGWKIPAAALAQSAKEVGLLARELGCPVMLKAQVLAGGRGKAGGVLKAATPEEAERLASGLLGSRLITAQTGSQGLPVNRLLVEKAIRLNKEYYCGLAVDRRNETLVAIASRQGGLNIEELSGSRPELIKKIFFNPDEGLKHFQARQLAYFLELPEKLIRDFVVQLKRLSEFFLENDLKLLEINPLAWSDDDQLLAVDARMEFDDCSLARHPELAALRDESQENELEKRARMFGLNYLKMNGGIGCLVNGAGLAMATMDIIQHFGGQPANFLDIGGGVTEEAVSQAFELLLSDSQVVAALINIFGGIVRCDLVARGVLAAASRISLNRPVVVRLEGTNVAEGRRLLEESGLPFIFASDFEQAARLAVELSGPTR